MAHFFSTIGIYNSAGEKVKVLVSGLPSQASPALDFALSSSTCAPGSGLAFWAKAGGKSFGWDGGNDGGQQIQNGLYYVKLEYRDPFGHVESVTHEVTVLGANQAAKVLIYNSAGELVRQLGVPSVPGSPPSRLQPDKASLAASQTVGPFGQIVFDLGNGSSVSWDGSNASGQKVAGGTYVAQLVVSSGQGPKIVASSPVSVINAPESLLAGAQLAPNPLRATTGGTKDAYLKFNAAPGVEVVGRLYNLAGELILTCTNDMNPGELHFGATALKASSGVYVLAVTAKAPWGTVERKNYKWVMLR